MSMCYPEVSDHDGLPLLVRKMEDTGIPGAIFVRHECVNIWMRVGPVRFDGDAYWCVQISNLSNPVKGRDRRKGVLDRLFKIIEGITDMPIYFENILSNMPFVEALERRGFKIVENRSDRNMEIICLYRHTVKVAA